MGYAENVSSVWSRVYDVMLSRMSDIEPKSGEYDGEDTWMQNEIQATDARISIESGTSNQFYFEIQF